MAASTGFEPMSPDSESGILNHYTIGLFMEGTIRVELMIPVLRTGALTTWLSVRGAPWGAWTLNLRIKSPVL